MMFAMTTLLVMVSPIIFVGAERSRVITSVTHTTQIQHKVASSGTSSVSDGTGERSKSLDMKQEVEYEYMKMEQCTDVPSVGLLSEVSITLPSSSTKSDFFVNIIHHENNASEELSSCLVIEAAGSPLRQRDLTGCSQVVHRLWHNSKMNNRSERLHLSFTVQDDDPEESIAGSSKVCVSWSHFEEKSLSAGDMSVNLTLIHKNEYFSDPADPSGHQKTVPPITSVKETLESSLSDDKVYSEYDNLFRVRTSTPHDSNPVLATSNFGYISRTVSVNSLVDSKANASLCNLTSTDQQLSSSLSMTNEGCNFRSAVEMCILFLNNSSCVDASATSCVVLLPPLHTIIMDPVFGEVKISDDRLCGSLFVEGSESVILPSSNSLLSMRLLNVDLPFPSDGWFSLHIDNVVIMNFGDFSVEGGAVRLNNFKSNFLSSVTNVIFRNNTGSNGGALAISNSDNMVLEGNAFEGNTARGDAGGLLINSDCENINISNCLFSYNTAMGIVNSRPNSAGLGGGAMINTRNSLISLHNCSFSNNTALRAGGLGVYDTNDHISLTEVSFLNNTGDRGGGMYAVLNNLFLTLTRCQFLGNMGNFDAGGLRLHVGNYYMTLLHCTFSDNSVRAGGDAYGGGLFINNNNYYSTLEGCHFYGNSANSESSAAYGGGIFVISNNYYFTLQDCQFTSNTARSGSSVAFGGGIFFNTNNYYFESQGCHFSDNSATSGGDREARGGGVYLDSNNYYCIFQNCTFSGNSASNSEGGGAYGGGMFVYNFNWYFKLTNCHFSDNSASSNEGVGGGGGISVSYKNYYFESQSCYFFGNRARSRGGKARGGGMYLETDNWYSEVQDCHFSGNTASQSEGGVAAGGAINVDTNNWSIIFQGCHLSGNSAGSDGGGMYMSMGNSRMTMRDCYLYDNHAGTGGAMFLSAGNWEATLHNVTCRGNVAQHDGGGVALISGNNYFTVSDSSLIENTAGTRGGGIYSALQNHGLQVTRSEVIGNSAVSAGGGAYIGDSHEGGRFEDVVISENTAVERAGGAFFARFSSEVILSGCQIRNNSAGSTGGLLVLADDMLIKTSVFEHNVAQGDFGALYIQNSKYFKVTFSNFSSNVALGNCGAMSVSQTESVTVEFSLFSSNSAGTGGAVCVMDGSKNTSFINTSFPNNVASFSAGALYVVDAINVFVKASSFNDNSALNEDGSAIYISSSRVVLESSSFSGNRAPLGGGTVFWKSASHMQEPSGLSSGSDAGNYFSLSNTARYGSWYATEARYIVSENNVTSLKLVDYSNQAAPPIAVSIKDWYNQIVFSDSSSSVTVSISTSITSDCYGEEGFVGGLTRLILLNGSALFNLLEPVCAPAHNLSLGIVSSLPTVASLSFQYSFRSCVIGEYYAERICNPCKEGSYSFVDPSTRSLSDLSSDVCQQCPSGSQTCFEDQIIVKKGHWRISDDSNRVFECPLDESSCLGRNLTGESSCGEGYSGALCAVCRDGYHYVDTDQTCEPCSGAGSLFDSFFVIIICLVIVLVVVFIYLKMKSVIDRLQISNLNELIAYFLISMNFLSRSSYDRDKDKYISMIQMLVNSIIYRFRIYFVLYQVVVALPFVLSLHISSAYDVIVSSLSFINLSVTDSSVSSCSFGSKFDFIDKLFFQTIYPMIVVALICIICGLNLLLKKKDQSLLSSHESDNWSIKSRKIVSKYTYIALFFIDLILPFTSAVIFSTFSCKNVDPESSEAGDDSFMTADYSVSCQSDRYFLAHTWATIMIFVYPVGVPACLAVILYRSRDDVKYRYMPLGDKEKETDRLIRLAAISSLYEVYKPEYWFWEVFEIYYRLLLTGFLVLIGQGLSAQIFFGIFVSFVYVKCQEIFMPYEDRQLNIFKMITLWQIFFIFFIALVSFSEIFNSNNWRFETVIYLVVFGNIIIEFVVGYVLPRFNTDSREKQLLFREQFQERSNNNDGL